MSRPRHRIVTPAEFKHRGSAWVALGLLTVLAAAIAYGAFPGPAGQIGATVLIILGAAKLYWGVHLWNRAR